MFELAGGMIDHRYEQFAIRFVTIDW